MGPTLDMGCRDFFDILESYLLLSDENSSQFGSECFNTVCEHIWKCNKCGIFDHYSAPVSILDVDALNIDSCVKALHKIPSKASLRKCGCSKSGD
jgi:hypothetical protein